MTRCASFLKCTKLNLVIHYPPLFPPPGGGGGGGGNSETNK